LTYRNYISLQILWGKLQLWFTLRVNCLIKLKIKGLLIQATYFNHLVNATLKSNFGFFDISNKIYRRNFKLKLGSIDSSLWENSWSPFWNFFPLPTGNCGHIDTTIFFEKIPSLEEVLVVCLANVYLGVDNCHIQSTI